MSRRIAIAGAGIAGLTASLFLARAGFEVDVHEQAPKLDTIGAGLQLSPNATRLLARLGLLSEITEAAVAPEAVHLREARTLRPLAAVRLGSFAYERWGSPYLVVHRGDLQEILLRAATNHPAINVLFGSVVGNSASNASLTIGADGVWSQIRHRIRGASPARFTGYIAWRALVDFENQAYATLTVSLPPTEVTALLAPSFHLIVYPVHQGRALNLVAVAPGKADDPDQPPSSAGLPFKGPQEGLRELLAAVPGWTRWPLYEVDPSGNWSAGNSLLIGDAAHAMTPYAAQGAAMAIEDAAALSVSLSTHADIGSAIARYDALRRPRLLRVAQRGRFNRFAWHAAGPIAMARNLVLKSRDPQRLAADLDWLYEHDAGAT